ncbi:phage tail tape measure protein [Leifsonia sp. 1010]|uniref:phage tail tape measure protein n=1 Tax=Leifsonia sp. 1010 TaxID=2817769 RepID=UPI002861EEC2|nr:phage tail tape measure protein [Leifsonia sp. 1010]MDR6613597.1 TP901 family phage tail tape measure protein [Leifsonia sp. 1010]
MTDRTVKVSLIAQVSGYIQGMEKAARATKETGTEAEKLAQKKEAFNQLGNAALAMGAVAAAGVAIAIKKFADWDAQMSQVQTLSHATADDMDKLRAASLSMGQAIGFSATEVADAETELVKAGISVKDMLGGALKGALDLAAAGQLNVADATSIAASAMTQFKLQGQDVPHIADLLAAGADKALGSVQDLGQGLKYVGPVAASMGISIEQTVGTLAELAQNGILADQAGTSLRGMLSSLTSPSAIARKTMDQYGISVYDATGKFIGFNGVAEQLRTKLGSLDQQTRQTALGQIFGNEQITTATVLMQGGAAAVNKWTKAVDDQGFAAEQARGKLDNLNGDLSKLAAAFDTALIRTGSSANDVLRGTVQGVTALTKAFGDLPGPAQGVILASGALVAGVGLLGGGVLKVVPMLGNFRTALDTLGTSMRTVGIAGGAVGLAVTGLIAIVAAVATSQAEAQQRTDDFTASLDQNTGAITKNTRATAAKQLHDNGSIAAANKLNISLKTVTDASLGNAKAIDELNARYAEYDALRAAQKGRLSPEINAEGVAWATLRNGVSGTAESLKNAQRDIKNTNEALGENADAADENTGSVEAASKAYLDAADSAGNLNDQIRQLTDEVNKANGVGQDAVSANASYQDSLQKVKETIDKVKDGAEGYSSSLDANTAAGADNIQMFSDLASKSQDAAKAQLAVDGNTQAYIGNLQAGRQTLIDNITALGGTAAQASAIADQVYRIPDQKAVKVLADTLAAKNALDNFYARFIEVTKDRVAHILVQATNPKVGFGLGDGHAYGGAIAGPGGPRDDKAGLYPLSNGEHVLTASDVNAMGGQRAVYEFRANLHRGFAYGGTPTYVPASTYSTTQTVVLPPAQVSLAGATLQATIDGRPIQIMITDQIVKNERAQARRTRMG